MTVSIWRYSHMILAIVSSLFLTLASLTGIVLAFEPISNAIQPYAIEEIKEISVAQAVTVLKERYDEVFTLEVDENDFVTASVITEEGNIENIYVHPVSGEKLAVVKEKAPIFTFVTNLHRSLFLKSIGRFFVGLFSFLLCLIAVTGFFLLIKRQGGWKKLFSKIHKDYFELRYHAILSRWFIIPIVIIAGTGVYLSAEKFSLLPIDDIEHSVETDDQQVYEKHLLNELPVFRDTPLNSVRKISFPFSDDTEDFYQVEFKDKEILVHQYTGTIVSEMNYPLVKIMTDLSLLLHTGRGSILWSIILLITTGTILFFMYSGFVMIMKRKKKVKTTKQYKTKDECEFIILVGSETGSTYNFARLLYNALIEAGQNVFIADLNTYTTYQKAKYFIVLTATYGEGEATTNARKFEHKFSMITPVSEMNFAVVGFGSLEYLDFCKYAIKVDGLLHGNSKFKPVLPLYKIDNQSSEAFDDWVQQWTSRIGINLNIETFEQDRRTIKFKVLNTPSVNSDNTFLLNLLPQEKIKFQSGDLLAIRPEKDAKERLYSVSKIGNEILLSVKKHELGLCSTYLSKLKENELLEGVIKTNKEFHFPKQVSEIIFISNGTGIAPFLGMIHENLNRRKVYLYWGGRTPDSFRVYKDFVGRGKLTKQLDHIKIAYSQENDNKEYVQNLILKDTSLISSVLERGGTIMICGSLKMQKGVLDVLEEVVMMKLNKMLSDFEDRGQLKMDCY
ncbi:oxidoreductase [Flavobacteriaceae bacterium R38]|nr:oxidoreductase [Flavobacteriaceae bacterium R38]